MSVRHLLAAAAVALSFAPAAHADEVIGIRTRYFGITVGSSEQIGPGIHIEGEQVTGACSYTGQTMLDGTLQFEYAGEAIATSATQSQPELTDVMCTLTSPAQGLPGEEPTRTASFEVACPLYACATASAVTGWPVRPVQVCVDGWSIFGPTPVKTVQIIHACKTSTI